MPVSGTEGSSRETSLVAAVHAFYAAMARGDAVWVPEIVADDPRGLLIGTDPVEWWRGFEAIRDKWTRARDAYGGHTKSAFPNKSKVLWRNEATRPQHVLAALIERGDA